MVSTDTKSGSKSSVKGDDFLAQVLQTEEQAEKIVAKAQEKKAKDLEKLKATLKTKREESLAKAKDSAKEDLEKATISAKMNYEGMIKDAKAKADDLLASKGGMVKGLLKDAQDFFLQQL